MRVAFFGGSHQLSFKTLFLRRLPKNIQEFPPKPNLPINFRFFLQGPKVLKSIPNKCNLHHLFGTDSPYPIPHSPTSYTACQSHRIHTHLLHQLFDGTSVVVVYSWPSHRCLVLCRLLQYPLFFRIKKSIISWWFQPI